jgi:DNA-binding NtrC family response regulator
VDYSDAICVPLIHRGTTLGAIHLYVRTERFRQQDFDFSISLASLLVVALVRSRHLATLRADHERLVASSACSDHLVGESRIIQDLKSKIARIARSAACVLIRGEKGVGKELVAWVLHRASARADRPLLSANCAALAPQMAESLLFGDGQGSSTGTEPGQLGLLPQADSGTLLLEEIGELPMDCQAKLAQVLDGHPLRDGGASAEAPLDVHVIATTSRDLRQLVGQGVFREGLADRLSATEIEVPPLRERADDLNRLIYFFLDHFRRVHGRPALRLSQEAREKLLSYDWPGNVRQLRNIMDSAVLMAEGQKIDVSDVGLPIALAGELDSLLMAHWEERLIRKALERTEGKVPEAAKLLGIGRATLYRKIEEYAIHR